MKALLSLENEVRGWGPELQENAEACIGPIHDSGNASGDDWQKMIAAEVVDNRRVGLLGSAIGADESKILEAG
ncbi:hypothetical protein An17g01845 [Aspergillus niger]|uniref:Uncharacterized protein n=2 Tax=Aspergillus niger TaxID=5061 RepID=A2R9L4_ASPNC|nr:hypothetical protein An17g01845 [Aspergillus niger]CAK49141.1 hypothetical protein An17g01845 [Aspergillus niger]